VTSGLRRASDDRPDAHPASWRLAALGLIVALALPAAGISADGRVVSFDTGASNLVPDDSDGLDDAYVRDLQTGTTTLVSRA
jgi:hypothetical protein